MARHRVRRRSVLRSRQRRLIFESLQQRTLLSGDLGYALGIGASGRDWASAVANDVDSNVYVAGNFEGMVDFDPGPGSWMLSSAGGFDGFIAKYSSTGTLIWARAVGGTDEEYVRGIAVVNLVSRGGTDVFVSKLDPAGNFVWARAIGGPGSDVARGLAVAADGGICTAGEFRDTADFDLGTLRHSVGFGFRLRLGGNVPMAFDFGFPIKKIKEATKAVY